MKMKSRLHQGVLLIIVAAHFLPVTAQINLALHGTVKQQTTYTVSGVSYDANMAIEGPANNNWEDGCSSTGYQTHTWWGLFLPRLAYITNVKSYYRKDEAHRMNDFRLYFANGSVYDKTELCFRDTGKQAHFNLNQSIDCNLSPTRNIYYFNRNTFIELCYIEINGCWKGFWGEDCTVPCPHNCFDQHCHPANGSCIWGCDLGKCLQGCFVSTGICFGGCVLGRAGQYCNKYNLAYNQTANIFPLGQSNAGLSVDGLISTCITFSSTATSSYLQVEFRSLSVITTVHIVFGRGCPYRRYGDNCEHVCPENCLGQGQCDVISGNCLSGCSDGWVGEKCDEVCDEDKFGGQCLHDCSVNCLSSLCDHVTGQCKSGCLKGWEGLNCSEECVPGYFGYNCAYLCESCFNQSCDIFEGNCRVGCNDGYRGGKCDTPGNTQVYILAESSAIIRFGFFIGGSASTCLVLLIIWMVKNARRGIRKKQESRHATCTDNSHSNSNEQLYDDIMKMEGLSTYQDLAKQTDTVSNDYDQINNSYINQ